MQNEHEPQLDALYAAYAPAIVRYLTRLTGSEETAEDLTQETFLKALRHQKQLTNLEAAGSWLFRIATNTTYDHFRHHRRHRTTPLTAHHADTLIAEPRGLPVEDRELLRAMIAGLPASYRLPLLLRAYAGYQVEDIAALLGLKVGTVKSRLHRARAHVQAQYAALH
jgi:RNA polymerase sigma-70 factor (ECF subfamily)